MSTPGSALPPDPALDRLLVEAFQRIRLERFDEAEAKLAEAKALAPDHPAVLETEGDLAFARRRPRDAEALYRRAHELDPKNARIEEKFATAVLKIHEPELLAHDIPDDDDVEFVLGHRKARPPWASTLFSFLFPGAGQMFNGETVKGWALFFAGVYLWSTFAWSWHQLWNERGGKPGLLPTTRIALGDIIGGMFHGPHAIITIFFFGAWIYGVVDAYLVSNSLTQAEHQRAAAARMESLMAKRAKK